MKTRIISIMALLLMTMQGTRAQTDLTPNGDKTVWTTTMPAYDIELQAEYYEEYVISFDANGGSGTVSPKTKFEDTNLTLPSDGFTRTGYTLDGWATTDDGARAYDLGAAYATNETATLYAHWTVNSYTITFDTDGGSEVAAITQNYGTAISAPTDPTKNGCTFAGWDTTIPTIMPAENMTIKATWNTDEVIGGTTIKTDGSDHKTVIVSENPNVAGVVPSTVGEATLTYTRELSASETAYTVCLPYTPPTTNLTYYTLSSVSGTTLNFTEEASPQANTPYLVVASANTGVGTTSMAVDFSTSVTDPSAVGAYQLKGTLRGLDHTAAKGKYILQSNNKWMVVDDEYPTVYIPPFRAYIESTSSARSLDSDLGGTTGIDSIRTIDNDGTEQWFDLSGCRLSGKPTKKGVYIHNGKKVIK